MFHAQGDFDNPDKFTEEKLISKFIDVTEKNLDKEKQKDLIRKILTGNKSLAAKEVFSNYYEAVR